MAVITVSRMYGSGGSAVAAKVAESLGWPLYDNTVIDRVAERSGLTRAEVAARDERVPGIVERLAATLAASAPEMLPPVPADQQGTAEERVVAITQRVIEEAVQQGPAVLVGRGAQCLLAERDDALHVFCVAPREFLVKYAIEHWGIAPADAERHVTEMNKQREQYVRRHWNRDWRAPENYHLCLNTAWLGVEGSADLVASVARRRFAI